MKKILLLFAALSCYAFAFAAVLTPQEALRRASQSPMAAKALKANKIAPELVLTGNSSDGEAAYYVFTSPAATLFVAADDLAQPLLGYSESGDFHPDEMPQQLKWWLDEYAREIQWAAAHPLQSCSRVVDPERVAPKAAERRAAISPLLTTVWNQTQPFNKFCPLYNGAQTVTGCVATSMAQVMNYHRWPQSAVASISYKWNNQTLTSPSVAFDWDNMKDSYNKLYTTAQADAVARLMQVAGYSVSMDYNTAENGGSGAYSKDVRNAFVNKFGYDVGMDYVLRDYYSGEDWEQLIYDNIANIGPVIYDGTGTNGGHSFVCDGYDGNGSFHFNWGWGGVSDGYFVLSALNPGELGAGGGAGGFNYNQSALVGIRLPQANSSAPVPYIGCNTEVSGSLSGRTLSVTATDRGGYYNFGVVSGNFTFGISIKNLSSGETSYVTSFSSNLGPDYGVTYFDVMIPSSLAYGSYEVRPVYKVNSGAWQLVSIMEGSNGALILNVEAAGLTVGMANSGEITLKSWNSPTGFISGEHYEGTLTVASSYLSPQPYSLDAYLCVISNNQYSIVSELGNSTVTIPARSTAEMVYSGTLDNLSAGTYYLVFAQNYSVIGSLEVEVTSAGELIFKKYNLTPEILVPGETSTVEAVISSTFASEKTMALNLYLCTLSAGQLYIQHRYGSQTVSFPPASEKSVTFSTLIPKSVADGVYYLVMADSGNNVLDYFEVSVNSSWSGLEMIEAETPAAAAPRYFNLQGVEVSPENLLPGIYILHQPGSSPRKIHIP